MTWGGRARGWTTCRSSFVLHDRATVRDPWPAHDLVAALRVEVGRNPYDRALSDLIGLLSTRSEEFRAQWARHDVWFHRTGTKRLHHPLVGDLTLAYEVLELPADPGLLLAVSSADAGSASEGGLRELARWSSTRSRLSPAESVPQP
jgi:hypothetical protein